MSNSLATKYPRHTIMHQTKLTKVNFSEWYRNLRNVLKREGRLYVVDKPFPMVPPSEGEKEQWVKHHHDSQKVSYLILSSLADDYPSEFRSRIANQHAYDMIQALKFKIQYDRIWRYAILKEITKPMKLHHSVKDHVERLQGYFDTLRLLGYSMDVDMMVDMVLVSLPVEYEEFIKGYNKNIYGGTIAELKNMLVAAEGKVKFKPNSASNSSKPSLKRELHPFDEICYFCGKEGHMNCTGKYSRLVGSSSKGPNWVDVDLVNEEEEENY